jgi:hypothetical protein
MGKSVQIDDSRWPLVTVRFVGDTLDEDFRQYLSFLNANMDRAEAAQTKTAVLFDARAGGRVSASTRQQMADWIRRNAEQTRRTCVGFAFVFDSAMVRGALTAILWLVPMPAPHTVVATLLEAENWMAERFAVHGVQISASRFSLPPRQPRGARASG